MNRYNQVNGTHSCQNDPLLNGLLKSELNYQGMVVSDYGAVYANEESANGGLDLLFPGSFLFGVLPNYFGDKGQNLAAAVRQEKVPEKRVDDMVLRILTPVFQHQNLEELPPTTINVFDVFFGVNKDVPVPNVQRDHFKLIRKIGTESITMVKNNAGKGLGLPLKPKNWRKSELPKR